MENKMYIYLEKIFKFILNFLTTILLLFLIITLINPISFNIKLLNGKTLQIISLILQIMSIIFSLIYDLIVKYNIFHEMQIYKLIGEVKEKTTIQKSREELRNSLNIITIVMICSIIYQYIMSQNLSVLVTVLLIIFVAYIYADYIPYTVLCGKYYDSKFLEKGKKTKMCRGLARIYLDEYKITKFNRKHIFYKELKEQFKYDKNNKYQDECIKDILRNWADYLTAPDIIINTVMFIINFVMLIASTQLENIVKLYIPEGISADMKNIILIIFLLVINIIFSYISYKGVNTCRKSNEKTKKICDVIRSKEKKERFLFFNEEYDNIPDTVLSRGTYEFNMSYTTSNEKKENLNNIIFPYRTLFVDRMYSHKQRFQYTTLCLTLVILSILLTFVVPIKFIILSMFICYIITLLLKIIWLPNIGKKRISKYCEELIKEGN